MNGVATGARRPHYKTWIRRSRLVVLATLSGVCLVGSGLAGLSPWFLLLLVPFVLFGYVATILALTVYRFTPRGGDYQRRIHELIVAKAALPPASEALDVGCGSGSLVVKLAKASAGSTVTGADSWGTDWQYSKELCEDNAGLEGVGDRTAFVKQSGAALKFADASFDVVVSCLTFHEIGDLPRKPDGVVEALRVLRPGGRYVFLDLFGDPAFYPTTGEVRDAIGRAGGAIGPAGGAIAEFGSLADVVPLPYPLGHGRRPHRRSPSMVRSWAA
jgi:SAM-dependent methyltransferase